MKICIKYIKYTHDDETYIHVHMCKGYTHTYIYIYIYIYIIYSISLLNFEYQTDRKKILKLHNIDIFVLKFSS